MLQFILARCLLFTVLLFVGAAFAQEPTASAPPCLVGQKLEFRQDDGRLFSRATSREADLRVVEVGGPTKSYYDTTGALDIFGTRRKWQPMSRCIGTRKKPPTIGRQEAMS